MPKKHRAALVEQIARDMATLREFDEDPQRLKEDPCGRGFYEQRIADYRAAVREMDE